VTRTRMRVFALGALLLMLAPMLVACGGGGGSTTAKKLKIGLVTDTGGLNDKGFNSLANQGMEKAKTDFGVQGDVKESKSDADYVTFLTSFASSGYDLVIAVGFLMQTAVGTVAAQFPNTHFAIIDGTGTDAQGTDLKQSNVMAISFKEQDAGALVGVISGMLEKNGATPKKTNVVSAVGGIQIPPVDHYIAGYKWGVLKEDPTATVLVGYGGSFSDQAKCLDLANAQIALKSEIVFQVAGGCGLGALQAAGTAGVYSIGVDTDQKSANSSVIASALKRVEVSSYNAIKAVHDGTFAGGPQIFGLNNDGVGYAPGNITLSADIVAEVTSVSNQIKAGTLTVPSAIPA